MSISRVALSPLLFLTFLFYLLHTIQAKCVAIPGPQVYDNYLAVTWPSSLTGTVLAAGYQVSGGHIIISNDYGVTWKNITNVTFGSLYSLTSADISGTTYYFATDDFDLI